MKIILNAALAGVATIYSCAAIGGAHEEWDDSPTGLFLHAEELLRGQKLLAPRPTRIEKDCVRAVELLNEALKKTDGVVSNQASRADAMNLLAYCYLEGAGVEKNAAKAAAMFEESGRLGKCKASSDAGMCYALGIGVKKDPKKAFQLITKAVSDGATAREGSPDFFEISMFKEMKWERRNFTLAFEAKNNLALCYLMGFGCEKNYDKACDIIGARVKEHKFNGAEEGLVAAYCLSKTGNANDAKTANDLLVGGVKEIVKLNTGDVNRFFGSREWIRRLVIPCEDMLADMDRLGLGAKMQLCVRKYAGDHVERDVEGALTILRDIHTKDQAVASELVDHLSKMCADGHPEEKARIIAVLKELVKKPDYVMAYWLGLGMCNGSDFFDVDLIEGRRYLELAADKGNIAAAQFDLGERLVQGTFGEADTRNGVAMLVKAAENGYVNAWLNLGTSYVKGQRGVEKDEAKGVAYIRKGAEAGDAMAQLTLGTCYQYGLYGVKIDGHEGFRWVNASYTNGYDRALYHMSRAYAYGLGVETNIFKAIDFALQAIDNGDDRVRDFIGGFMPTDESPNSVNAEDVARLKVDADKGVARAQYLLARSYFYGMGIEKNEQEAIRWAKKAASQNYADGANLISVYYFEKALKDGNYSESNKWGFRAIALGSLKAMLNYSSRYEYGKGVEIDENMAARLVRVAAVCGLSNAQFQYGLYLHDGIGVKKDRTQGMEWIETAAKNGCQNAIDLLKKLKEE